MVDTLYILLTHGLLLIAFWRLAGRRDWDADVQRMDRRPPQPEARHDP